MSAKQPASSLSNAGVWRKHRDFLTVCALLLVAFLLRLPALEARPLWYDEAFSVLFAKTGLRAMIRGTLGVSSGAAADVHPLFYYTLLSTWMRLFGSGVMTVRMLSVVISLLTLVVVWKMMHEMFGYEAALFSGVLFALSPFQIQYGQEARMYGLMNLWILLCAWLAWRGTLNPGLLFFDPSPAFPAKLGGFRGERSLCDVYACAFCRVPGSASTHAIFPAPL